MATDATALGLAKKAGDFSTAGASKAYSYGRNRKDKCGHDTLTIADRVCI